MTLVLDGKRVIGMVVSFEANGTCKVLYRGEKEPTTEETASLELRSLD